MSLKNILNLAIDAAHAAGDHARNEMETAQVSFKAGDQIVTQLDKECQAMIIEMISKTYPNHGLIGEEGVHGELMKKPPAGSENIWWVIDPIDGTRNFAHQIPNYAVSIGIMQDDYPVAGVIYDPTTKMTFAGIKGEKATCNGQPIECLDETLNSNSQVALSGDIYCRIGDKLGVLMHDCVCMNLGSAALHYAFVAKGAFAAAVGWKLKLWDIAAGAIIAECAQAVVRDTSNNPRFPIDCNAYQGESLPIVIASESIQQQLQPIINSD